MLGWRGSSGVPISGKHMLKWTRLEDMDEVVEYLRQKYKVSHFYMAGFSVGGNLAQLYFGKKGELKQSTHFKGAISVASPTCLRRSQIKVDSNFILKTGLIGSLRGYVDQHMKVEEFIKMLKTLKIDTSKYSYPEGNI